MPSILIVSTSVSLCLSSDANSKCSFNSLFLACYYVEDEGARSFGKCEIYHFAFYIRYVSIRINSAFPNGVSCRVKNPDRNGNG